MDGALLVDKPAGMTSAGVVARIKRLTGEKRVGHAGTLDPDATGLLVILLGRATKLQEIILTGVKAYHGVIRLGVSTTTDDLAGEVVESSEVLPSRSELESALLSLHSRFLGKQQQTPPQFSAIRVEGKRSYDLARQGVAVALAPREIEILSLSLNLLDDARVEYSLRCSKGTYVRSFARDLGQALGVPACVESIRRTESQPFSLGNAHTLETLTEGWREHVLPVGELIKHLPRFELPTEASRALQFGIQAPLLTLPRPTAPFGALYSTDGVVVGVLERDGLSWRMRFLVTTPIER